MLITFYWLVSVDEKRERTLNNIMSAKNKIRYEISELNDRLKQSKESIAKLKMEIAKMEEDDRIDTDVVTWCMQKIMYFWMDVCVLLNDYIVNVLAFRVYVFNVLKVICVVNEIVFKKLNTVKLHQQDLIVTPFWIQPQKMFTDVFCYINVFSIMTTSSTQHTSDSWCSNMTFFWQKKFWSTLWKWIASG